MPEAVENLLLEHLKRFQSGQDRIERKLDEVMHRLSALEAGQGVLIQHIGHLSSSIAGQQVSLDRMSSRVERIERRLGLADAT